MRIWWQSSTPIEQDRLTTYRNRLRAHLESVKRPDTEIRISGVDDGSFQLDYDFVVETNTFNPKGGTLTKILTAEREGYDAVAIGCFLDPALLEAREWVDIPVLALGETCMVAALMLGHKVSGVAFSDKQALRYTRQAWELGLSDRILPFGSLGIDFPTLNAAFEKPGPIVEGFQRAARKLVEQGAEVIIPACGTLDLFLAAAGTDEIEGARVMHADATLLKLTEAFADMAKLGIKVSRKLLYQGPAPEHRQGILDVYGFTVPAIAR